MGKKIKLKENFTPKNGLNGANVGVDGQERDETPLRLTTTFLGAIDLW